MSNLNESHVEEATLEWFGELGYAIGHEVKEKRDAIRRLNPAPTVKESLSVQTKEPKP